MLCDVSSSGATLYVPAAVTVCTFEDGRAPICSLCHALMWWIAEPMTSYGSPYSAAVQLGEIATRTAPEVQLNELAWCTPKLWLSSCAITRGVIPAPLIQVREPGMYARPDHAQPAAYGNTYITLV